MSSKSQARAVTTFLSKGQRPSQEDYAIADQQKGIFIVADGFGGPVPGANASKTVCEAIRGFLFKQAGDQEATLPFVLRHYFSLAGNVLFNSLIHANRVLNQGNHGKNINERGGASAIAALIDGDFLALANVGSCGGWLFRDGKKTELVISKSFGRLCDPFRSQSDQPGAPALNLDLPNLPNLPNLYDAPLIAFGMAEDLEPEIVEYRVHKGDWLFLATDGASVHPLSDILLKIQSLQLNSDQSIQEINQSLSAAHYSDNVSIVLVII